MLRAFIITLDEPVYAPVYLTKILDAVDHEVVGVTALSPTRRIGALGLAKKRWALYGPWDFLRSLDLLQTFLDFLRLSGYPFLHVSQLIARLDASPAGDLPTVSLGSGGQLKS